MVKILKEKGYSREKIVNLMTFLDGVLFLPYEIELKYEVEAKEILGGEEEMVAAEMTNLYQAHMWKQMTEVAKKMLKRNKPIDEIIEFTDLSKEDIEKLKKEI